MSVAIATMPGGSPAAADRPAVPDVDPYNGRFLRARGGSELMYDILMRRLPPDLADRFQIIVSRVRELQPGKKPILWCQDTWNDPEAQHLSRLESRLRFKKIVFVSQYQFNTFHQALKVPHSESVILRNAIEPIGETLPAKPTDRIRLIYHTTPHRGLAILVPVFMALAAQHPRLHLDVYSSFGLHGWEQRDETYEPLFQACREHPQISYHGAVPNDEIRAAVASAHIFAYPSIWRETSCIASIEAMSAGALVVCPDLAALSETVSDYCGVMYRWHEDTREHARTFASALGTAIDMIEQGTAGDLVKRARERADVLFNWNSRIDQWTQLMRRVIDDDERRWLAPAM
jgi:UDP-glucose:(glucosyl)LPS alpha-1,2-glucosyltransferase